MAVRSARLFGPTQVSTSNLILATVPAERTWILKHLAVANISGSSSSLRLRLNGTAQQANIWDEGVPSTAADNYLGLFIVLEAGDVLRGIASVADSLIVTGFGADLVGVAS